MTLKPMIAVQTYNGRQENRRLNLHVFKNEEFLFSMAATTISRALRHARRQLLCSSGRFQSPIFVHQDAIRLFHATTRWAAIKPFLLADVGEGMYFDLELFQMIVDTHSFT